MQALACAGPLGIDRTDGDGRLARLPPVGGASECITLCVSAYRAVPLGIEPSAFAVTRARAHPPP